MKYDFDELVERKGTGCVKWDERPDADVNPSLDLIPLWVADMDFKAAPAILEAVRKRAEHGVFGYTVVEEDYYEAVISWFRRRHHWTIQREEILYTARRDPLYDRCCSCYVGSYQGSYDAWRKGADSFTRL